MEMISYGGGVQTVALLVLNAQGKIENPAECAVFADTGSEMPATLDHVYSTMVLYGKENNIPIHTVKSENGPLHEYVMEGNAVIPMFGDRGGMIMRRCTHRWKIQPVRRWLRAQGVKSAVVQLGISIDEVQRAKDSNVKWAQNRYPLIELRLSRQDCINTIKEAGLPVPPRSACWMCPFRKHSEWTLMKDTDEFRKAVDLEKTLDGLYLHPSCVPLDRAIGDQYSMFQDDECGGYCWT